MGIQTRDQGALRDMITVLSSLGTRLSDTFVAGRVLSRFGTGQDTINLGVNDEDLRDNSGSFSARIRVFRNPNMVPDSGFEQQSSRSLAWPWFYEGYDYKGVDIGLGLSHSGANNAFIRTSTYNWNSLDVWATVIQGKRYRLQGFIRTSRNFNNGFFGIRASSSNLVLGQVRYAPFTPNGYQQFTVDFDSEPFSSWFGCVGRQGFSLITG